jgi:hypothetical protein
MLASKPPGLVLGEHRRLAPAHDMLGVAFGKRNIKHAKLGSALAEVARSRGERPQRERLDDFWR